MRQLLFISFIFLLSFSVQAQDVLTNGMYLMVGAGTSSKDTRVLNYSETAFPQVKLGKLYYFGEEGNKSNFAFNWTMAELAIQAYKFRYGEYAIEVASRAGFTYSIVANNNTIDLSMLIGPTILTSSNTHEIDNENFSYTFIGYSLNPNVQWRINNKFIIGSSLSIAEADAGSGNLEFIEINEISSTTFTLLFGLYL